MKFDPIKNPSYVATIVRVEESNLYAVPGLDNLIGYTKFGMQALVSKDTAPGLYVLFSTEVQLSLEFAKANNLHRDGLLNGDPLKVGYLEDNRRVKALKLRKNVSSCLLMPLDSLNYLIPKGVEPQMLCEGDVFDSINGHEVCRKYVVKETKEHTQGQPKARTRRVDAKVFPEHIDSEQYFRNSHKSPDRAHVVVSQKLHGTSVRYGNVPVLADQTWWEKLLRRPRRTVHRFVVGSRRVVKSVDLEAEEGKANWYADGDLWTRYADRQGLADRIPKDHIVYGELVGFTGPGSPIQKDYTYAEDDGHAKLYVYRVAVVTADGRTVDYSSEQMEMFCTEVGLTPVPVLWAGPHQIFSAEHWLEKRYYDDWATGRHNFNRPPVQLSDSKLVDEGICIRYDGPHGAYIVKAKSPSFFEHETKMLDAGTADLESDEAEAPVEVAA
jgi:hypothetical protein